MTDFLTAAIKPGQGLLLDRTKGSSKNKIKCFGEHNMNMLGTSLMTAGTVGAAYVATQKPELVAEYTKKSVRLYKSYAKPYVEKFANTEIGKKAADILGKTKASLAKSNLVQKLMTKLGTFKNELQTAGKEFMKFAKSAAKSGIEFAKKNPKTALIAATVLTLIGMHHMYKAGQIDQKYTDKAKLGY